MSVIIAYAISFLLSIGVISREKAEGYDQNLRVYEREGKTVVFDSISGHEIIIAL
jgi:hypothetical protein